MNPAASVFAIPSGVKPRPLICECGAIRDDRAADVVDGGGRALCATGVEDEALKVVDIVFVVRVALSSGYSKL